jgi:hypothetical protein
MKISTEVYVKSSLKLMHSGSKQVVLDNSENVSNQGPFKYIIVCDKIHSKLCGKARNLTVSRINDDKKSML